MYGLQAIRLSPHTTPQLRRPYRVYNRPSKALKSLAFFCKAPTLTKRTLARATLKKMSQLNGFSREFTHIELASECKHSVYNFTLTTSMSRHGAGALSASDAEPSTYMITTSPNILLCSSCEEAMIAESKAAKAKYVWHCANGLTDLGSYEESVRRCNKIAAKIANHADKMADLAAADAKDKDAPVVRAPSGKKVSFDILDGMGAGDEVKVKSESADDFDEWEDISEYEDDSDEWEDAPEFEYSSECWSEHLPSTL